MKFNKPIKIIHLSSVNKESCLKDKIYYNEINMPDAYFVNSWAGLIARRFKNYKPDIEVEYIRVDHTIDNKIEKNVYNIKSILWPYKIPVIKNTLTFSMIKYLNKNKKKYNVILHYHNLWNISLVFFISILCPGIKLVLSHHGGIPPKINSPKDFLIKLLYKKNRISYITYLTLNTKHYFQDIKNHPKLKFLPVGTDFNIMKPNNKILARKKLGLDTEKVYAIYVGKYYKLKSVDLILEIYHCLKNKYNFSIIFVGGDESDELYINVRKSGCPEFGKQPWTNMKDFYNAADFYIHPVFNENFGGLDVSWMEALACNIPVLTPQLINLDFDYSELGILINNQNEAIEKTEWMINNYKIFTKCREVAMKYLDANTAIMYNLSKIYEEIL